MPMIDPKLAIKLILNMFIFLFAIFFKRCYQSSVESVTSMSPSTPHTTHATIYQMHLPSERNYYIKKIITIPTWIVNNTKRYSWTSLH